MKQTYTLTILDEDDEDERLDKYIPDNLPIDISRSYIQKLIKSGDVLVNGKIKKPNYILKLQDNIEITIPKPIEYHVEPNSDIPIDIVYEDKYLLVINKPAGLVVHPSCGHMDNDTLVSALLFHCKNLSGINGVLRPGIVHRLDMDTSGLMIVAKDDITHRALSKQLQDRTLSRIYNAICYGNFDKDTFSFTSYIGRSKTDRKKMAVLSKPGKTAISHFTVLKRFAHHCLMQIKLETGRTHQIRVHLSHLGHPVVGDSVYGKGQRPFKGAVPSFITRQALHAKKISFFHPIFKKEMEFEVGLPEDMQAVLKVL